MLRHGHGDADTPIRLNIAKLEIVHSLRSLQRTVSGSRAQDTVVQASGDHHHCTASYDDYTLSHPAARSIPPSV